MKIENGFRSCFLLNEYVQDNMEIDCHPGLLSSFLGCFIFLMFVVMPYWNGVLYRKFKLLFGYVETIRKITVNFSNFHLHSPFSSFQHSFSIIKLLDEKNIVNVRKTGFLYRSF